MNKRKALEIMRLGYDKNLLPKQEFISFNEKLYADLFPGSEKFLKPLCTLFNISDKERLFYHYKNRAPRYVYLKPVNGLCNRLRTLNSFKNFCDTFFFKLKVVWTESQGWSNEHFLDLFDNEDEIEFIELKEYEKINFKLDRVVFKSQNRNHFEYSLEYEKLKKIIYRREFSYEGCCEIKDMFKDIPLSNDFNLKLIPKQIIQKKINEISKKIDINNSIGLHLRRGDSLYSEHAFSFKKSDDQAFKLLIDEEIKKNKEIKFFLSTDCEETNNIFLKEYPNHIFCNTEKKFAKVNSLFSKKFHQDEAVIDLLLLSQTKKIIGTNSSSFSTLSSKINKKELIIAKSDNSTVKNELIKQGYIDLPYCVDWQFPSVTEKHYFNNHKDARFYCNNNLYFAFPWASLLDNSRTFAKNETKYNEHLEYFIFSNIGINDFKYFNTYTVCQHIKWRNLIPVWEKIGIKNVCISHLTQSDNHSNINLIPWYLSATNFLVSQNNRNLFIKPIKNKKYLCSFIGSSNKNYRSNIRQELFEKLKNKENVFINLREKWFYNDLVYAYQIENKHIDLTSHLKKVEDYNNILSDSVFSLCPEGTGPNTIRLWESLCVGSIPILFENDWVKPKIKGFEWNDISVTIKNNQLDNIVEILNEIPSERIQEMQINCINAYNVSRTTTCF